jgi:hypothetical protein
LIGFFINFEEKEMINDIIQGVKQTQQMYNRVVCPDIKVLTNKIAKRIVEKIYEEEGLIKSGKGKRDKLSKQIAILLREWIEDPHNGKNTLSKIAEEDTKESVIHYIAVYFKENHVTYNKKGEATDFLDKHKRILKKGKKTLKEGVFQSITVGFLAVQNVKDADALKSMQKKWEKTDKALKEKREEINRQVEEINSKDAEISQLSAKLTLVRQEKNEGEKNSQQGVHDYQTKLTLIRNEFKTLKKKLEMSHKEKNRLQKEIIKQNKQIVELCKNSKNNQSSTSSSSQLSEHTVGFYRVVNNLIERRFCQARNAIEDSDYSDAIDYYEAIPGYEEDIVIQYNLGNAYYFRGEFGTDADSQKKDYKKALECYNNAGGNTRLTAVSRQINSAYKETVFERQLRRNKALAEDALRPPGLRRPLRWVKLQAQSVLDKVWGLQQDITLEQWKLSRLGRAETKKEKKLALKQGDKSTGSRDKGKQHASSSATLSVALGQGGGNQTKNTAKKQMDLKPREPDSVPKKKESVQQTVSCNMLKGLKFQKVPADGHCLFRAIGLYLNMDAAHLRLITAAHMEYNASTFKKFRQGSNKDFQKHINAIRDGKEWGDAIEIEVIQRLTRSPIIIIQANGNPVMPDKLDTYKNDPIFIYYNGVDHYDAFIVRGDNKPREILNNIRQAVQSGQSVTVEKPMDLSTQALDSAPKKKESIRKTVLYNMLEGLKFQKIPADGHCLFRALGLYLNMDAAYLRRITAAHMEHNANEFKKFGQGDNEDFQKHTNAIRDGKEWGDAIEIEVIQRLTRSPIIIIQPNGNPVMPDKLDTYKNDPIFIYYNGVDHYDAFIVRGDNKPREILNNIRQAVQSGQSVTFNFLTQSVEHSPKKSVIKEKETGSSSKLDSTDNVERSMSPTL